VAFGLPIL
jgi:flagellar biosynthesis/type III secretory pathway M-ring protein FliF/YscJ